MSKNLLKSFGDVVKRYSPEILIGVGITGMISTTVLAVRATPKALKLIEDEKRRQNYALLEEAKESGSDICNQITKLPVKDVVKTTWTCYIPSVALGTASVLCLVGASSAHLRRNAALATAYALSESAFKEYQEKVIEEVGEKKERAVRDSIAKDSIEKNPVTNREVIITGKGTTLCFDRYSSRYFESDIELLRRAENELNRRMRDEMYVSLNEFYYEIGLDGTKLGDDLGWNIETGYIDLDFSSQLAKDGRPALVVDYHIEPRYEFQR